MSARTAPLVVATVVLLAACSGGDGDDGGDGNPVTASRCRVDLHGKGGDGAPTRLEGDVAVVSPTGNGEGWGGREWRYDGDAAFSSAAASVRSAVDAAGCERIAIHGFSNGAAFAAALICTGETFGGRLVGVLVDDPVTDAATTGCRRPDDVPVALVWTGALDDDAPPGTDCGPIDWTCAGGMVRGVDAFADDLGVVVTPSPNAEHARFDDAPQPVAWLAG